MTLSASARTVTEPLWDGCPHQPGPRGFPQPKVFPLLLHCNKDLSASERKAGISGGALPISCVLSRKKKEIREKREKKGIFTASFLPSLWQDKC